jgi:GNAT superfamily N-acetyltransferase
MSRRRKRRKHFPATPVSQDVLKTTQIASIEIRGAKTEDDVVAIFQFLMRHMADEVALVVPDPHDVMRVVYELVTAEAGGAVLMAMSGGTLVGVLGLEQSHWWYNRSRPMIFDRFFYVLPEHRSGDVGLALLQEARSIADSTDNILIVVPMNPNRRRGERTGMERVASLLRYIPGGSILAFHPRDRPHVLRQ